MALAPPAGPLACGIPRRVVAGRRNCRRDARRLCDSGFSRLCDAGRAAAAGRHLRLSAGRARLRLVGHLADDRRNRRRDGGRRRAALRTDREPRRLHCRGALSLRLDLAAERAREADQRQHPGRLQGRRRTDHRDDAAAEPVWRARRRAQFLRSRLAVGRATRSDAFPRAGRRHFRDRAARARRASAAAKAGRPRGRRAVDCDRNHARPSRPGRADDRRDPGRPSRSGGPAATAARR